MRLRDLGVVDPAIVTVPSADVIATNTAASVEVLTPAEKVNGVVEPATAFVATVKLTVINN